MEMHYTFSGETCGYSADLFENRKMQMVMRVESVICLSCVLVIDVVSGCEDSYMLDESLPHSSLKKCPVCGSIRLVKSCTVS